MEELIKDIKKTSPRLRFVKKYILNKYSITIFIFLVWMTFFDSSSFLVINELNQEINRNENRMEFYKAEYKKNDSFYKSLMFNKSEREKFARENYFMKKKNEEIFILVVDSTKSK